MRVILAQVLQAMPMQQDRTSLARRIASACTADGWHRTAIPGLYFTRSSSRELPRTSLDRAILCMSVQGAKSILLDGKRLHYDPSQYLLCSLDLPLTGQLEDASPERPFLGVSLELDLTRLAQSLQDTPTAASASKEVRRGIAVGTLDDGLLNAVCRIAALLDTPEHIAALAPVLQQEIYVRLLLGEHGSTLRGMVTGHGRVQRVAQAMRSLRAGAHLPIRMRDLAQGIGMSLSGMHAAFREVTGLSPLQFQKQVRLQEARRLMLMEAHTAATAAYRVGYQSASQFSREYRGFFGASPTRDVQAIRALHTP